MSDLDHWEQAPQPAPTAEDARVELWPGDPGTLPLDVRRVLVALLRGPYLSHQHDPVLWSTLLAHEAVVRRHLGDLLLELAIDADSEVAFSRNLTPDPDFDRAVPSVLRTAPLSFIDSALLLHLRHLLLQGAAQQERAVVGREEIDAHMRAYAPSTGTDEAAFTKRLTASVKRMRDWLILLRTDTEERWEVSSILALILTPDVIGGIEAEYERLREQGGPSAPQEDADQADSTDETDPAGETEPAEDADPVDDADPAHDAEEES